MDEDWEEGGEGGGLFRRNNDILERFIILLPIVSGANEFEFAQVGI